MKLRCSVCGKRISILKSRHFRNHHGYVPYRLTKGACMYRLPRHRVTPCTYLPCPGSGQSILYPQEHVDSMKLPSWASKKVMERLEALRRPASAKDDGAHLA